MANALKKINARVKVLQGIHPNKKRSTLQKQAGREWTAGKLKGAGCKVGKVKRKTTRAKAKPRKRRKVGSRGNTSGNTRTATKASTSRNRTATSTKTITAHVKVGRVKKRRRAHKARVYKAKPRRRVSGIGKTSMLVPIVAIVAVGALAYYFLNRQPAPQLLQTNNIARVNAQNNILSWAAAAGLAGSAIANIINALNNSDDNTVIAAGSSQTAATQYFNPLGNGI